MNKIILLSNSRTALVAVQIYLSGIISITLAQEMSPEVLERVRSASVEIHIKGQLRGGGAIVTNTEGKPYVVTAAHLFLDPKDTCLLITHDGESHFGSLTTYDLGHDLALLEVPPGLKQYGHLSIATRLPRETQAVFNLGPALRRRTLVLSGHVADIRNSFTDFTSSKGHISHYFVAGINPVLTSGGAWVNRDGEIVGVQHGRLIGDQGAPSSGLSMVSPPSAIRELLEAKKIASTPGIGGYVWETWTADRSLLEELPKGTHGLIVNPVFENRPFARAGISAFDVILSVDGKPVQRRHELLEIVRSKPVGTNFLLELITPGSRERRTVELKTDRLEDLW